MNEIQEELKHTHIIEINVTIWTKNQIKKIIDLVDE